MVVKVPGHDLTAAIIQEQLKTAPPRDLAAWRQMRRGWSRALHSHSPSSVVKIATDLLSAGPWGRLTAYELIACHPTATDALTPKAVRHLGQGLADWGAVDAFACYVAGPAWREGRLATREVHRWLRSPDRWRRRTAVVATVALNVRARGGGGDVARTLEVCRRVVADRDHMVSKALSWALRSLVQWDREAVSRFLGEHDDVLAARVKREVRTKLQTGRKNKDLRSSVH
jgi:3-methyladenine DNA glycosylase AlkD